MELGLSFLPDASPAELSAREYFTRALELTAMADAAGLASVKMTEHYLHPYGGYCPSPLGFLAAAAARTRRLRLITGGVLPAFHHPIQLASDAAMLDAISGGRLEIGFARAYLPYEFAALGVPLDESRRRFTATVDTVIRLWTETGVTAASPYFSFQDCTVLPRPTQRPHPPVWIAASVSPESFEWVGRRGFGLMATSLLGDRGYLVDLLGLYRDAWRKARPAGAGRIALSIPLLVAESDRRARRDADRHLSRYLAVWADAASAWRGVSSDAYPGYARMAEVIAACAPERLVRTGGAVVGCPARVADAIAQLRAELGADELLWQIDFGVMPHEHAVRTLRLLVDEVLCRLPRGSTAPAEATIAPAS